MTAIVSTKNEAVGIEACVSSLKEFDEVIVVDSISEDRTCELATRAGATVVEFRWNGAYPKKKQWILDNVPTKNEWILFVDGDESPDSDLIRALHAADLANTPFGAFDIRLNYYWQDKRLRHGHRVEKRALLHKCRASFPEVDDLDLHGMGELEGHYQPETAHGVGKLPFGRINHRDRDPFSSWISRHNKYSDWEAGLRVRRAAAIDIRLRRSRQGQIFDRVPFKPIAFFLYSYVFRLGFLDGRAGFEYAGSLAWYYWTIEIKRREIGRHS